MSNRSCGPSKRIYYSLRRWRGRGEPDRRLSDIVPLSIKRLSLRLYSAEGTLGTAGPFADLCETVLRDDHDTEPSISPARVGLGNRGRCRHRGLAIDADRARSSPTDRPSRAGGFLRFERARRVRPERLQIRGHSASGNRRQGRGRTARYKPVDADAGHSAAGKPRRKPECSAEVTGRACDNRPRRSAPGPAQD